MYYIHSIDTYVKGQKCKKTNMLKGWQLIENAETKLKKIETQNYNETFNNINNNISANTSTTSTSL